MQIERPKAKKKNRIKDRRQEVEADKASSSSIKTAKQGAVVLQEDVQEQTVTEVAEEEKAEELGSWEDLHEHIENIESMYPSAPSGNILEVSEPEDAPTLLYPPVPLLTMTVQKDYNFGTIPGLNYANVEREADDEEGHVTDFLTPSAPPNALLQTPEATAPTFSLEHAYLNWSPLPSSLLEQIYSNPLEVEHKDAVAAFRSASMIPEDNWLYRQLLAYEHACFEVDAVSKRASASSQSIKLLSQKYWTMKREPVTVNEYCGDGWSLSHTYVNEIPQCNHDLDIRLENACHDLKRDLYIELPSATSSCSVSKLFIQTHLDDLIPQELKNQLILAQSEGRFHTELQFSKVLQDIMDSLDVLFVFERKSSAHDTNESLFHRHIQQWITLLAGCIFRTGIISLKRRVLLHILRTKGIAVWGASLVSFPFPITFSEVFLDDYLVSLKAFLGPIEELDELLAPKRREEALQREFIQRTEGEKWIVVEDGLFNNPTSKIPNSIILSEQDYIALFSQFNLISSFRYFVRFYFLESVALKGDFSTTLNGNLIMKGFSIAHQIFSILSRTLHMFPSSFSDLRKVVASQIVLINEAFQELLKLLPSDKMNNQVCFSLPDNSIKYTSVQSEVDSFLYRSANAILSKSAAGIEVYATSLPLEKLSKAASVKVMGDILSGRLFHEVETEEDSKLLAVLLRAEDSNYLFYLLQKLLLVGADMGKVVGNQIVICCFDICLSNKDFQQKLFLPVRDLLKTLCEYSPHLIGFIIQRCMEKFTAVEDLVLDVFASLPVPRWTPLLVDVLLIENMLKDPIGSVKSKLACLLVDAILWEEQRSISYEAQKTLAYALVNIHLDVLGRSIPSGLIQETTSAISKSAKKIVGGIGLLSVDSVETFQSWIWLTLQRLQLYRRPNANNIYTLSDPEGIHIDSWDNPSLSTIKGYSNSDPISAFTLLLISEVGHRFDLFEQHGWALLQVLVNAGAIGPLLKASFDIFRNFVLNTTPELFSTKSFRHIALQFCKNPDIGLKKEDIVGCMRQTLRISEDFHFAIKFWCNLFFADHDWMHTRFILELLDELCQIVYSTQYSSELLSLFSVQYRSLLFGYNGVSPSSRTPGYLTSFFDTSSKVLPPTLIQERSGQFFGRSKYVAEGLWYFLAFAFSAEVFAEREVRSRVGQQLILGNYTSLEKSISQITTVRLAETLMDVPLDHPMSPLFFQTFFSLYFERKRDAEQTCFGHLFFDNKKDLLISLEKRLSSYDTLTPSLENWKMVIKAFALWIFEPRILLANANFDIFDYNYCPSLLKSCAFGLLFENGTREWWQHLFPSPRVENHYERNEITPGDSSLALLSRLQLGKQVVNLESPRSYPVLVFTEPILTNFENENISAIMDYINKDLNLLKQYGLQHSSSIQAHSKLDFEYINLLSKLYTTTSASSLATKRCSSSCSGVIFQYEQSKSIQNVDISRSLSKNRRQLEVLIGQDIVNQQTSFASVRILKCLRWLLTANQKATRDEAIALFYHALDLLDERLHAYPPAEKIINSIIKDVGMSFIVGSPVETKKLFYILTEGRYPLVLLPYFLPSCLPEEFVEMYKMVSISLSASELQACLSCFHIRKWQMESKPSKNELSFFLDVVLDSISKYGDLSDPSLQAHLISFKDIISLSLEGGDEHSLLVVGIQRIWRRLVTGGHFGFLIREWLLAFLVSPDGVFPDSWSFLIVCTVDKETVHQIISSIQIELSELFLSNPVKFIHTIKANLKETVLLLQSLFSCNVLYAQASDFELHNLWGKLFLVFLPIFQIPSPSSTSVASMSTKYHEILTGSEIDELVRVFCSLSAKITQQNGKPTTLPALLWRMYSCLVPTKSFLLLQAFHSKANAMYSPDFLLDLDHQRIIRHWIEKDLVIVSSIRFLCDIVLSSTVDLFKTDGSPSSRATDLLFLLLYFLSHLNDLETAKKKILFSLFQKHMDAGEMDEVSGSDFAECLSILPQKWFEGTNTLALTDNLLPLPSCLHILLKLIGRSRVDQPTKCNHLVDYFCQILSLQVFSEFTRDALIVQSQAFAPEDLGNIVAEFLEMTEKEWNCICVGYTTKAILIVFTKAPKEDKVYARLSNGLIKAMSFSAAPLEFLEQICRSACSPEQMALFCEASIANFISKAPHSSSWEKINSVLKVPDLEESTFIRHCISHCLVLTLYSHSVAKLTAAGSNLNMKLLIGEQIAVWIESLQIDASITNPPKVLLMLMQLFALLCIELDTLPNPDHSRLYAHLKPIQEVLFRWSNPPSVTLWSALGFSQQLTLSPDLRLLCRFLASFIASRLIGVDHLAENDKLADSLNDFISSTPESSVGLLATVSKDMKAIFQDTSKKMISIGEITERLCQIVFPSIANLFPKKVI